MPIGYAVFAVALGITAGTLLRRTLPAVAVTLGFFIFLRILVADFLRPHYLAALTKTFSFLHSPPLPEGSYWLVSGGVTGPGCWCQAARSTAGPASLSPA